MKLRAIALLAALSAIMASADSKITFAEKSHDFGNIAANKSAVTHEFSFTNDGDSPLVILSAKAECGCTRPKYPLQPIAPGETAQLSVTFYPEGRPGEFVKTVKVTTNDPKAKKVKLKISGVVVPAPK